MRLNVQTADNAQAPAFRSVLQKYAVFSDGPPIGTTNMMNCLGIVIYNRVGACGIEAHVEAAGADYAAWVDRPLETMTVRLNEKGGGGRKPVGGAARERRAPILANGSRRACTGSWGNTSG